MSDPPSEPPELRQLSAKVQEEVEGVVRRHHDELKLCIVRCLSQADAAVQTRQHFSPRAAFDDPLPCVSELDTDCKALIAAPPRPPSPVAWAPPPPAPASSQELQVFRTPSLEVLEKQVDGTCGNDPAGNSIEADEDAEAARRLLPFSVVEHSEVTTATSSKLAAPGGISDGRGVNIGAKNDAVGTFINGRTGSKEARAGSALTPPPCPSAENIGTTMSKRTSQDSSKVHPEEEMPHRTGSIVNTEALRKAGSALVGDFVYPAISSTRKCLARKSANDFISSQRREQVLSTRTKLQRIVEHKLFEWSCMGVIAVNALVLGIQTQTRSKETIRLASMGQPILFEEPLVFELFQIFFTLAYLVELILRWAADGFFGFFATTDRNWNVLDIFVVLFSVVDVFIPDDQNPLLLNASMLRVVRVVRIVRVAKVIRIMRFFRELRIMIYAILRSMKLMAWALSVLLLLLFVFGVSLTSGTTDFITSPGIWDEPEHRFLLDSFGTLDRSILNLYEAMSGGKDWGEYYHALEVLPAPYTVLFLAFISFSLLAVVNVITGIFVDSAFQCNQNDRDIIVHEEMAQKRLFENNVRKVFEEIDEDGTGQISLDEFERRLDDARVLAYFNSLKLDAGDAKKLFTLLDYDESGEIDVDEFLSGCQRLKGESRALDTAIMQLEIHQLSEALAAFRSDVGGCFKSLGTRLHGSEWNSAGSEPSISRQGTRRLRQKKSQLWSISSSALDASSGLAA